MKKKRNILMCLQQLDIGGVETAVLTLCKGYIRAGCKVYVASKGGLFLSELKKMGVGFLDIEYKFLNHYALEKKDELVEFCKKNKITEIHIHQYPCVVYWLPVCMELKIPYVAYVHSIVPGAPQWFMRNFPVYKTALPIFFENASKIVCIAHNTKDEIENLFNIGDDHYKIIPNSLNMEDFKQTGSSYEIKTFGIVSRLAEEKMLSLTNSINLFLEFSKTNKNCKLLIAGDGSKRVELEKNTKKNKNIKFIGAVSDIPNFLAQIDVFIGVDRSILEAMASKKLAIISSYNGNMNIISSDNIKKASNQNFSGNNMDNCDNLINDLINIDNKKYKKIVDENYDYINRYYNVDNNLYVYELKNDFSNDYLTIFSQINKMLEEIDLRTDQVRLLNEKNKPLISKLKKLFVKIYNKLKSIYHKLIK